MIGLRWSGERGEEQGVITSTSSFRWKLHTSSVVYLAYFLNCFSEYLCLYILNRYCKWSWILLQLKFQGSLPATFIPSTGDSLHLNSAWRLKPRTSWIELYTVHLKMATRTLLFFLGLKASSSHSGLAQGPQQSRLLASVGNWSW